MSNFDQSEYPLVGFLELQDKDPWARWGLMEGNAWSGAVLESWVEPLRWLNGGVSTDIALPGGFARDV